MLFRSKRLANRETLDRLVAEYTKQYSAAELEQLLREKGIAAAQLLNPEKFESYPFFQRSFIPVNHPVVGEEYLFGNPWRFKDIPNTPAKPAPLLGEHNHFVLTQILNYSPVEIEGFQAEKVIY